MNAPIEPWVLADLLRARLALGAGHQLVEQFQGVIGGLRLEVHLHVSTGNFAFVDHEPEELLTVSEI